MKRPQTLAELAVRIKIDTAMMMNKIRLEGKRLDAQLQRTWGQQHIARIRQTTAAIQGQTKAMQHQQQAALRLRRHNQTMFMRQQSHNQRFANASQMLSLKGGAGGAAGGLGMLGMSVATMIGNLAADVVRRIVGAIRDGISRAISLAKSLVDEGIAFNAQMETVQIGFENMLGSAAKAKALMADIQQFAAVTPFSITDVADLAQQLLVTKKIAEDQLIPTMRKIGDAAAGSAKGFQSLPSVTLAITQMLMKGKIAAQEMSLQLVNAGIPAWDILAEKTGKTTAELMKLASQGKLGTDAVLLLIEGMGDRFEGVMEKQSKSWSGMWERISDSARIALGEITGPLFEKQKRSMQSLVEFMESGTFQKIVDQARGIVEAVVKMIDTATTTAIGLFKKLTGESGFFMNNWRDIFAFIAAKAAETASYLYDQFIYTLNERLPHGINALWDGMWAGAQELGKNFRTLFEAILKYLDGIWKASTDAQAKRIAGLIKAADAIGRGKFGDAVDALIRGEGEATAVKRAGQLKASNEFATTMAPIAASVAAKVREAMDKAMKGMPEFKESERTSMWGKVAGMFSSKLAQRRKEMEGADSARSKIRSGIDFLFGNAAKGIGKVQGLFGGKPAPLAAGLGLDEGTEKKKARKAEFVGFADLNRKIQESLTTPEDKDRKAMVKAAEAGADASKKTAGWSEKIFAGIGTMTRAVKDINLGFAE